MVAFESVYSSNVRRIFYTTGFCDILISILVIANHEKEDSAFNKRIPANGVNLKSISLAKTSKIDLTSVFVNSLAGIGCILVYLIIIYYDFVGQS